MGSEYWTTIGEIADVFDGPHATPKKIEKGAYFLSISSLEKGKLDLSKSAHLSDEDFVKWTRRITPQENDVLFSYETRLGEVALMPDGVKACLGRRMGLLRPYLDKVNPRFLVYAYLSPVFQMEIRKRTNYGATVERIALKELPSFPIVIPPLPEQKAIAHILGALDDKIELNRQMNETLEAMAQALFKSWFVDFDPVIDNALAAGNPIPDVFAERAKQRQALTKQRKIGGVANKNQNNPAIQEAFPNAFEYTEEMEWIPEGWRVNLLANITSELRRGISPKYTENNGVSIVNQRCIRDHSIDFSICRKNDVSLRKVDGRFLELGDLLINSTGVGTLGRMAQVIFLDAPTVVDSHVTIVRPNTDFFKIYTFSRMMLSIETTVEAMGLGSTGQTELSRKDLGQLNIIVPPMNLQNLVENTFKDFSEKSVSALKSNITLTKLRDTLLPKLLSGELRIPDAEKLIEEAEANVKVDIK